MLANSGSKLKANASKHKALSWAHLHTIETQLKAEVAALMEKAASAEANDLPDGMDLPAELVRRQERLAALDAARLCTVLANFCTAGCAIALQAHA